MKILQVINNFETGGAEKLLLETIPLLQQKGIQVDLLVLDGKEYPYLEQLRKLNCCSIYSMGIGFLYNPFSIFKMIPLLRQYDIAHVHLFPAQYFVVFSKLLSFSKCKLVFTEHNTHNERINNFLFKYPERFIYSLYKKVICITQEVRDVFVSYTKLDEAKFQVIENGVNLEHISQAEAIDKKSLHSSILPNDQLIIQVAAFRIQKDQKTVIRALQYLDESVKLLLVGEGALKAESKQLAKDLGLENRVLFLGGRNDVPCLLKTADISVVSSHWEGFGLVAVEGMAAGIPVIASNVLGLANVVEGAGVLFEKGDEKELAAKIKELLDNSIYRDTIIQKGLKRAKQYDIGLLVQKQIDLYKDLLK